MKSLMLAVLALGVLLGAVSLLAQSVYPVRFDEPGPNTDPALTASVDSIHLSAVRWVSRDSAPFACDASRVGYVYLQRDVPNFTQPSHALCICRAKDIPPPAVYRWETVGGGIVCADLE
jgi:hypothetical protein